MDSNEAALMFQAAMSVITLIAALTAVITNASQRRNLKAEAEKFDAEVEKFNAEVGRINAETAKTIADAAAVLIEPLEKRIDKLRRDIARLTKLHKRAVKGVRVLTEQLVEHNIEPKFKL